MPITSAKKSQTSAILPVEAYNWASSVIPANITVLVVIFRTLSHLLTLKLFFDKFCQNNRIVNTKNVPQWASLSKPSNFGVGVNSWEGRIIMINMKTAHNIDHLYWCMLLKMCFMLLYGTVILRLCHLLLP